MFILGILVFLVIIGATMLLGANSFLYFLDIPSLIFVVGLYFAVLVSTKGLKDFTYGLKCIVKKDFIPEKKATKRSLEAFRLLNKTTPGICILGFFIGLIALLSKMDDVSTIGPSVAVALLVTIYTVIINTCFIKTAMSDLKKKLI
jgi:flagellar motor component MotA